MSGEDVVAKPCFMCGRPSVAEIFVAGSNTGVGICKDIFDAINNGSYTITVTLVPIPPEPIEVPNTIVLRKIE